MIEQMPHCDSSVLHAPGECQFCDRHPDWQEYREAARINFSGHNDEGKAPCPSEHFRPPEVRDRWPGNVAAPEGEPVPSYWPPELLEAVNAGQRLHTATVDELHQGTNMISRLGNRMRAARNRWGRS